MAASEVRGWGWKVKSSEGGGGEEMPWTQTSVADGEVDILQEIFIVNCHEI
jgi:hypothetical protein